MRGVVLHLIVLPEKHVKLDPPESPLPVEEASQQALEAFRAVLDNSLKLELDHHIAYFAHYEYARLLTKLGKENHTEARKHLSLVLDGKVPLGPTKGKGKVSLHNIVVLRANAACKCCRRGEGLDLLTARIRSGSAEDRLVYSATLSRLQYKSKSMSLFFVVSAALQHRHHV